MTTLLAFYMDGLRFGKVQKCATRGTEQERAWTWRRKVGRNEMGYNFLITYSACSLGGHARQC